MRSLRRTITRCKYESKHKTQITLKSVSAHLVYSVDVGFRFIFVCLFTFSICVFWFSLGLLFKLCCLL